MTQLIKIMNEYTDTISDLIIVQDTKLKLICDNDIHGIEELMKQEQALSLKLRGIDNTRESWQANHGFANMSFKNLIPQLDYPEKQTLINIFNHLNYKIDELSKKNKNCQKLIQVNLHNIEKLISYIDTKNLNTYDNIGQMNTADNKPKNISITV